MHTQRPTPHHRHAHRRGFALIVVLSSLAILTIIFSVASSRTMSRLLDGASERMLAQRQATGRELLTLALQLKSSAAGREQTEFRAEMNGVMHTLFLQDVGGLIDLNTAAPEILERVVEAFELGPEAMTDYIAWRRSGRRLLRVGDFLRVTGAGQDQLAELFAVATVHSGRRGIAPDLAPIGVLAILGQDELPPAWLSPPSGVNYAVGLAGENARRIGVVHVGQAGGDGRVLAVK